MANWTAFTPFWANATNPASPMWPPAMMSTSHDRLLGHGGLLAVWDESDQWHQAAEECLSELLGCRADLVTSSFV
jgi:hypothetical protein